MKLKNKKMRTIKNKTKHGGSYTNASRKRKTYSPPSNNQLDRTIFLNKKIAQLEKEIEQLETQKHHAEEDKKLLFQKMINWVKPQIEQGTLTIEALTGINMKYFGISNTNEPNAKKTKTNEDPGLPVPPTLTRSHAKPAPLGYPGSRGH